MSTSRRSWTTPIWNSMIFSPEMKLGWKIQMQQNQACHLRTSERNLTETASRFFRKDRGRAKSALLLYWLLWCTCGSNHHDGASIRGTFHPSVTWNHEITCISLSPTQKRWKCGVEHRSKFSDLLGVCCESTPSSSYHCLRPLRWETVLGLLNQIWCFFYSLFFVRLRCCSLRAHAKGLTDNCTHGTDLKLSLKIGLWDCRQLAFSHSRRAASARWGVGDVHRPGGAAPPPSWTARDWTMPERA